jgi:hypothetical protein
MGTLNLSCWRCVCHLVEVLLCMDIVEMGFKGLLYLISICYDSSVICGVISDHRSREIRCFA